MSSLLAATDLLKGIDLTPGQQAEFRAISALYYSQLAGDANKSIASSAELDDLVLSRVRAMLRAEQLIVLERNLASSKANEARGEHPLRASP